MARNVTTLEIWIRAAARSEARHLVMQDGLRRASDPAVRKLATKAGTSPLPPGTPVTDHCGTAS